MTRRKENAERGMAGVLVGRWLGAVLLAMASLAGRP